MKKRLQTDAEKSAEVNRKIRKEWGGVKPYTVPFADKRKKKPKHKERYEES